MSRAVSIHIGVNQPQGPYADRPLRGSEDAALAMAGLAGRAGYDSLLVLRGPSATQVNVHDALAGAARALVRDDVLLVSFSGHGGQERDCDYDERQGCDESWCLFDGALLDDKLAGYWRLFEPGVRIVVVSESCYSGGMRRGEGLYGLAAAQPARRRVMRGMHARWRGPEGLATAVSQVTASCIAEPPRDCFEIRASVLMLTASSEEQPSQDGLFTRCLLDVWADGAFQGSYCDLYREVRPRVMREANDQEPQILMLGAPDPDFPLMPAFHRGHTSEARRHRVYR